MKDLHQQYIDQVVKKYENPDKNSRDDLLIHSALGLSSDYGELLQAEQNRDNDNILEELGDLYYFLFQGIAALDLDLESVLLDYGIKSLDGLGKINLQIEISKLVDYAKGKLFYNKQLPEDEELIIVYARIYYNMKHLLNASKINEIDVINANAKKLNARYGDKFSEEKAKNRDKAAEMKAMTNG